MDRRSEQAFSYMFLRHGGLKGLNIYNGLDIGYYFDNFLGESNRCSITVPMS